MFTIPPCRGGGCGGDDCSSLPCPKKILGIGGLLSQMQGTNTRKVYCSCVYYAYILSGICKQNRCISVRLVSEMDKSIEF